MNIVGGVKLAKRWEWGEWLTMDLCRVLYQDERDSLIFEPPQLLANTLWFGFGGLFFFFFWLTEGSEVPGKFRAHSPSVWRALRCLQRRRSEKGRVCWRCLILAVLCWIIILDFWRTCRFSSRQNQLVSDQRKVRLALRVHVPDYRGLDAGFVYWNLVQKLSSDF